MKQAIANLKSTSPYSQGKYYDVPKLSQELPNDYESRTWRERMHYTPEGEVFIPPMAFNGCVKEAAKYMSISIPGKGQAKYTKHFNAGVLNQDPLMLGIQKDEVDPLPLFVPSDGKKGGGKRVHKVFPVIHHWGGEVTFVILDDIITEDIFKQVLDTAGQLIGVGVFRPQNGGYYGRFEVKKLTWIDSI